MAMPEVNIGLFPDVGGSHFLSHAPGALGMYLGLTGLTIGAADALYVGLADVFVPSAELPALQSLIAATPGAQLPAAIRAFAAPFAAQAGASELAAQRALVDRHFGASSVQAVMTSLARRRHPVRPESPGRDAPALAADDVRDARDAGARRLAWTWPIACAWSARWCAATSNTAKCWKACARW